MKYTALPTFVVMLVLIAMLVGVGVLTFSKFGSAAKESTVITNESFTVPAEAVTLAHGNITSWLYVLNATGDVWGAGNYSVDTTTGVFNNTGNESGCVDKDTCYAYYTYDEYNTETMTAASAAGTAVGDISNTWLTLIVTIGLLAIIIGMVVAGFMLRKR